jgi:hypothetical protein
MTKNLAMETCGDQILVMIKNLVTKLVAIKILVFKSLWQPKNFSITIRFKVIEIAPVLVFHKRALGSLRWPLA